MFVRFQKFTAWHLANWIFQIGAMGLMIHLWGINPFLYFITSTFLAGAWHPMSGHFLAEHYVFVRGYETYSYYGPLNMYRFTKCSLGYNVGYHNEHHDFPRIPGSRLPLVRQIAPEFYNNLPIVKSWPMTIFNFIFFPHITPFNRVKRKNKKD
jgi:sphingolipid delta-4 desaturase